MLPEPPREPPRAARASRPFFIFTLKTIRLPPTLLHDKHPMNNFRFKCIAVEAGYREVV